MGSTLGDEMIESTEDLFANPAAQSAIVITTNGSLKHRGPSRAGHQPAPRGVMGRGCAAQAKALYPWSERRLGEMLVSGGNRCHILCHDPQLVLVSFPVKHEWNQQADLDLIARSAYELNLMANTYQWTRVLMPRPGCGNGGRTWEEVKPILERFLGDDRFVVTHQLTPRELAKAGGR